MLYTSFNPIQPITTARPPRFHLSWALLVSLFDEPTSNIAGLLSVNVCPSIIFITFSSTFTNITWFGSRKARAQDGLVPAQLLESVYIDRVDKYSAEPRDMEATSPSRKG
jgi:hypothetical protein